MKRVLLLILCVLSVALHAADFTPITPPSASMQSVNNTSYMSSGSFYTPDVYEVGSYSPAKPSIRKAPPSTGGTSDYDPNNPQFAPLTDALIPLFLFALGYLMYIRYRKRQEKNGISA